MVELEVNRKATGVADWNYLGVRIKMRNTELLSRKLLEELLGLKDLKAITQRLQGTAYAPFIKEAQEKYSSGMNQMEIMNQAVKLSLVKNVRKIRGFMAGNPLELMNSLLRRWDLYNVKTILREKHAGHSPAQISQNLLPLGEFSEDFLEKLCNSSEPKEVIDIFARQAKESFFARKIFKWFYGPFIKLLEKKGYYVDVGTGQLIEEGWENFSSTGSLLELELALDKWYYKDCLKTVGSLDDKRWMRKLIKMEIDLANAMMVIRLAGSNVDGFYAKRFFIRGGHAISMKTFVSLSAKDSIEEIVNELSGFDICKTLADRMPLYRKLQDVSIFERVMWANIITYVKDNFGSELFGIGVLITYLQKKYNEMVNLRIIMRSKEFGMPDEIVKGELIFA